MAKLSSVNKNNKSSDSNTGKVLTNNTVKKIPRDWVYDVEKEFHDQYRSHEGQYDKKSRNYFAPKMSAQNFEHLAYIRFLHVAIFIKIY